MSALLKSLFSSVGRTGRQQWWTLVAILACTSAALRLAIYGLGDNPLVIALLPVTIANVVIGINNNIKRLHDFGRSGWWLLLPVVFAIVTGGASGALQAAGAETAGLFAMAVDFIGLIGFAVLLGGIPGDAEDNRFGPPPSAKAAESVPA